LNGTPDYKTIPRHWGPVKRLWWAVILQAVEDIEEGDDDAAEYITGTTFELHCRLLGFTPDHWRRATRKQRAAIPSRRLPFPCG